VAERLRGKICLITGAASGIGRETVRAFHTEGARVVAIGLDATALKASGADMNVVCDVANEPAVVDAVGSVQRELGPIDAVVTCAGVALEAKVHETSLEAWNHVIAVNLTGSFLFAKHSVQKMRQGGSMIFISSMSALVATADEPAYCASKAGVIGLMRSIAVDYADVPIRSNCICPGVIDTPMNEPLWAKRGASFREAVERAHPLGRLGTPRDIANMAVFLASDESAFVTGSTFVVDGGYTAR
jgi:NAD(P)-dependent dehydrogenase (short-subunit alcohol dehydrogenase family)